jgi:TRAP-type C4-dicarboxylate transport system permease small subunit
LIKIFSIINIEKPKEEKWRICGMAWIIMLLVWAAVTVLVGYPYVKEIEKVENDRDRFFSYFALAVGGWSMLIAGLVEKVLEKTGVLGKEEEEEDSNNTSLW